MLAYLYLSYSMMALVIESVPRLEDTWIECLGDLVRYKVTIEEPDLLDRQVWAEVARMWYNQAADLTTVLARPNIV
jgi:hypothetical protein